MLTEHYVGTKHVTNNFSGSSFQFQTTYIVDAPTFSSAGVSITVRYKNGVIAYKGVLPALTDIADPNPVTIYPAFRLNTLEFDGGDAAGNASFDFSGTKM
jgi:hypothetical protein